MNGDITRKQRSRFFATNVAAFAFIFFLLGFITLQILNQSAYRETDLSLEKINFDSRTVQLEIQRYQQGDPFLNPTQTEQNRTNMEQPLMEPSKFILHNDATLEVPIDEKKIHQVLVILLDNALKYTNPEDKIILDSSVNHKEWLIHVKNTGPSISEEDQARIFDRFYREDQSRAKETGGYGLGLAIAKQVIEQHHGQISVSNYLPQGVDFKVQLPLKPKK